MRERKFKVVFYHPEHNGERVLYDIESWDGESITVAGLGRVKRDSVSVVEYIGLKDINGEEIYEGDVLYEDSHWLMYVKFVRGSYCLVAVDSVQRKNWVPVEISEEMVSRIYNKMIVGNILSNPEILETDGEFLYEEYA